jgi:signal transduction histidine kinase/ligand-binding sensor domain-containing protein
LTAVCPGIERTSRRSRRRAYASLVIALAAMAGAPSAARSATALRVGDLNHRLFTPQDGLPQANVTAIAQTREGYLWLGTEAGLARFDGASFVTIDAPGPKLIRAKVILALLVDRAGALWVGMDGGPGLVRIRQGRLESFQDELMALPRLGLSWNAVTSMAEDRAGTLWFGSWNGLLRRTGEKVFSLAEVDGVPVGMVSALAADSDGTLWIGTWQGELLRHREGVFERFGRKEGLPGAPVRGLAVDREGGLWIATSGSGLLRRDAGGFRAFERREGLPHNGVASVLAEDTGDVWAGTEAGLARLREGRVEVWPRPEAAPVSVNTLTRDREGNLWAGTPAGLLRLNGGKFSALSAADGTAIRGVLSLHESRDGALWIGTSVGRLLKYEEAQLTVFDATGGLCLSQVRSFWEDDDGALWLGGALGGKSRLCRFEGGRFIPFSASPPGWEFVRALFRERGGALLVGASQFVSVAGDRLVPVQAPDIGFISAMGESSAGELWVGGVRGLLRRDREGMWRVYRRAEGLPSDTVHALHFGQDGSVWAACERGIALFRNERLQGFDGENGLFDDRVRSITGDGIGALWLCTPRGIFRVREDAFHQPQPGAPIPTIHYGADDGLPGSQCLTGLAARDGRLWFATTQGPLSIDPHAETAGSTAPPTPIVESVTIDGRAFAKGAPVEAPPGRGDLRIDYTAPSFIAPARLAFRYKLEPFDREWIEAQGRRSAFYTNLPPGSYRFQVAVAEGDRSAEAGAAVALTLAPHFHQTLPFRGALVALAMLGVLGLHRLRIRRLAVAHAAVLQERTRIAREIHDTLAQGFTGITIQIDTALDRLEADPAQARTHLQQARLLARTSLAETHQAVWDLRMAKLAAGSLAEALRAIGKSLERAAPVEVSVIGAERTLPALQEGALLRISQEALTNAVRHAQATRILVRLEYHERSVRLRVQDDGVGFDPAQAQRSGGHFGLQGIRERVEMLRGSMELETTPGAGTTLAVELPLPRRA